MRHLFYAILLLGALGFTTTVRATVYHCPTAAKVQDEDREGDKSILKDEGLKWKLYSGYGVHEGELHLLGTQVAQGTGDAGLYCLYVNTEHDVAATQAIAEVQGKKCRVDSTRAGIKEHNPLKLTLCTDPARCPIICE